MAHRRCGGCQPSSECVSKRFPGGPRRAWQDRRGGGQGSDEPDCVPHSSHWGAFAAVETAAGLQVRARSGRPGPSPLLGNVPACRRSGPGCCGPRCAAGWLEHGPGPDERRGRDDFVEVGWDEALDLLAAELRPGARRARQRGDLRRLLRLGQRRALPPRAEPAAPLPEPARRLHRARSTPTAPAPPRVILPHVARRRRTRSAGRDRHLGADRRRTPSWSSPSAGCRSRTRTVGARRRQPAHRARATCARPRRARHASSCWSARCATTCRRRSTPSGSPIRPGTDTALMLGAGAHAGRRGPARPRVPRPLLRRAAERSSAYLLGDDDGAPKTPHGPRGSPASPADDDPRAGPADGGAPTLITVEPGRCSAPSTASSRSGRASRWPRCSARSGCPAAGSATASASLADVGRRRASRCRCRRCRRAATRSRSFIPVARVADMLLQPRRRPTTTTAQRPRYPRHPARLLGRRQPVPPPPGPRPAAPGARPAGHVRRARAVLDRDGPARRRRAARSTTTLGARRHRRGAATTRRDRHAPRGRPAAGEARDDYAIFAGLAERLGVGERVHRGPRRRARGSRTSTTTRRAALAERGAAGARASTSSGRRASSTLPARPTTAALLADVPRRPGRHTRCRTPSGRIEISSATIAGFGYADCPGHPAWLEPERVAGPTAAAVPAAAWSRTSRRPGCTASSTSARTAGRRRSPAASRAHAPRRRRGARHRRRRRRARVQRPRRAAWPARVLDRRVRPRRRPAADRRLVRPGRPARRARRCACTATRTCSPRDVGTSRLAQGCTGQLARVEVRRAPLVPPVQAYDPPGEGSPT